MDDARKLLAELGGAFTNWGALAPANAAPRGDDLVAEILDRAPSRPASRLRIVYKAQTDAMLRAAVRVPTYPGTAPSLRPTARKPGGRWAHRKAD